MVAAALVTIVSLVASSFLGYWIHRALHQTWMGRFHRAHMQHHRDLYPPGDLTSIAYRQAYWYNRGPFLFTPPFVVIVIALSLVARACHLPAWMVLDSAVTIVGFGMFNDWVHDRMHLRRHWLQRIPFYRRMRVAHFVHHNVMSKNFGIASPEWDRVFKTEKRHAR